MSVNNGHGEDMDERRLRRLFRFDEADLAANRRGHFSKDQIARLEEAARNERKTAWKSAAIAFVIAAAGMALGIGIGSIAPNLPGRIAMYLFMGALWPLVWSGRGIQIILAANSRQGPRLWFVKGPVRVVHHGEGGYTIQVKEFEFDVDGNPSGVFVQGDEYTIYYVDGTEEILSVDD
jgi:hypothetical protein